MLPTCVSPNLAAALTGRSPKAIRELVGAGLLPATDMGGKWTRIPLSAVEKMTGRKVTAEDYLLAQASLETRRAYWRSYRHRERGSERYILS